MISRKEIYDKLDDIADGCALDTVMVADFIEHQSIADSAKAASAAYEIVLKIIEFVRNETKTGETFNVSLLEQMIKSIKDETA